MRGWIPAIPADLGHSRNHWVEDSGLPCGNVDRLHHIDIKAQPNAVANGVQPTANSAFHDVPQCVGVVDSTGSREPCDDLRGIHGDPKLAV